MDHVAHSGTSGAQNVNVIFFIRVWPDVGPSKSAM
jgi:hypothetical protein